MKDTRQILSVSEITRDIKLLLENTFEAVWVEGEVSNFKAASSGHFYFSLKDSSAVLSAAMFARQNRSLPFKIEDGQKVVCSGKIDVYQPRGAYQLIVERIEPVGIGAAQLALEQLKEKLAQQGLFDPARKRQLPLMPFRIGIVTSAAGAAVQDILQILKKGAPCVDVLIRSVRVQGEGSAGEIAEAIGDLNRHGEIDLIIISRGGGSVEDLWSFNDELVARAIASSGIPTISAVGHQINVTLSDLAADVFVETPSAAAKIVVDKKNRLLAELDNFGHEIFAAVSDKLHELAAELAMLRGLLKSPLDRLLEKEQLVDELSAGLNRNMKHYLQMCAQQMGRFSGRLEALSPLGVLARGYSLSVRFENDEVVTEAGRLAPGDLVKTTLARGSFVSEVREVKSDDQRKGIV